MHLLIKTLQNVSSRYAPSRLLSFNLVHIFKTLQLIENNGHVSRDLLSKELNLGEGSIKTLIKHLKMQNLIVTNNQGTKMTDNGRRILTQISSYIITETKIPKCSIAIGEYNYAVLLRQISALIKLGIEQRDAAIKYGAMGATTLLYKDNKFLIPSTNYNSLEKEPQIKSLLISNLKPQDDDIIIVGSDNISIKTAELAAKCAALLTIRNHNGNHNTIKKY